MVKEQNKNSFIALIIRKFKALFFFLGSLLFFFILAKISGIIDNSLLTIILDWGILVPILVLIGVYFNWNQLKKIKPDKYTILIFNVKFNNKKVFLNMILNSISLTIIILITNLLGVGMGTGQSDSLAMFMFAMLIIPYLIIDAILALILAAIVYFKNK